MSFLISAVGNDSKDPALAELVYNPKVNYTGCVITIGFWRIKTKLPLILIGMPSSINYYSFLHDVGVGDYSDYEKVTKEDGLYVERCKAYSESSGEPLWNLFAINAMVIIRTWTIFRTTLRRFYIRW